MSLHVNLEKVPVVPFLLSYGALCHRVAYVVVHRERFGRRGWGDADCGWWYNSGISDMQKTCMIRYDVLQFGLGRVVHNDHRIIHAG